VIKTTGGTTITAAANARFAVRYVLVIRVFTLTVVVAVLYAAITGMNIMHGISIAPNVLVAAKRDMISTTGATTAKSVRGARLQGTNSTTGRRTLKNVRFAESRLRAEPLLTTATATGTIGSESVIM